MRKFKSKRKLVGANSVFRPWKNFEIDDSFVGIYKGSRDNVGKFSATVHDFEVLESDFADGFTVEEGKLLSLNSMGSIDNQVQELQVGEAVQMTYVGEEKLPPGHPFAGGNCHQVELVVGDFEEDEEDSSDDASII